MTVMNKNYASNNWSNWWVHRRVWLQMILRHIHVVCNTSRSLFSPHEIIMSLNKLWNSIFERLKYCSINLTSSSDTHLGHWKYIRHSLIFWSFIAFYTLYLMHFWHYNKTKGLRVFLLDISYLHLFKLTKNLSLLYMHNLWHMHIIEKWFLCVFWQSLVNLSRLLYTSVFVRGKITWLEKQNSAG